MDQERTQTHTCRFKPGGGCSQKSSRHFTASQQRSNTSCSSLFVLIGKSTFSNTEKKTTLVSVTVMLIVIAQVYLRAQ